MDLGFKTGGVVTAVIADIDRAIAFDSCNPVRRCRTAANNAFASVDGVSAGMRAWAPVPVCRDWGRRHARRPGLIALPNANAPSMASTGRLGVKDPQIRRSRPLRLRLRTDGKYRCPRDTQTSSEAIGPAGRIKPVRQFRRKPPICYASEVEKPDTGKLTSLP